MQQKIKNLRLQIKRLKKGYTQADLAQKAGVQRQTLARWESGMRLPDFDTMFRVATILETTVEHIFPLKHVKRERQRENRKNMRAFNREFRQLCRQSTR